MVRITYFGIIFDINVSFAVAFLALYVNAKFVNTLTVHMFGIMDKLKFLYLEMLV
jgi:hypothetical protein